MIIDIVEMLKSNWNPITNLQNQIILNSNSGILTCINYWLEKREEACELKTIRQKTLKNNKILMSYFKCYLDENSYNQLRVSNITNIIIKEFMDQKAFDRNWGKVTCLRV